MAAPDSAYHDTPRLKIREGGTLVEDVRFAKYLSPYTSTADIKAMFFLDNIIRDTTFSPNGFIGIVSTPSKVAMHSSSRLIPKKDGTGYYCRDAGLNTKGECVLNTVYAAFANYIRVQGWFKSGFFVATTSYGTKINGSGYHVNGLAENTIVTQDLIRATDVNLTPGSQATITVFNTNPEGENVSTTYVTVGAKIWTSIGAGAGVGGGTVYKLSNATEVLSSSNIYNGNSFFMNYEQFTYLASLPLQGQLTTYDSYAYKTDAFNTVVESGLYYIANEGSPTDPSVPIYGNTVGNMGKVFHVDSNGKFDYYLDRVPSTVTKVIKIATGVDNGSVTLQATLYERSGGVDTPYNNNLGQNIVITAGIKWYNTPSGGSVAGSTTTPTQGTMTILQNGSSSNFRNFTIDEVENTPPYVGGYTVTVTPAIGSTTFSAIEYDRVSYPY